MRSASLSLSATAVVAVALGVIVGAETAFISALTGIVAMMTVAIRQLMRARRAYPSNLDQYSFADRKRVRKVLSDPQKIASLSRPLRGVTLAIARRQVHTAAAVLPWWVSCIVTFAGVAVWQAFATPSRGSLLNVLAAGFLLSAPAALLYEARKGRAVLAEFPVDPGLN